MPLRIAGCTTFFGAYHLNLFPLLRNLQPMFRKFTKRTDVERWRVNKRTVRIAAGSFSVRHSSADRTSEMQKKKEEEKRERRGQVEKRGAVD